MADLKYMNSIKNNPDLLKQFLKNNETMDISGELQQAGITPVSSKSPNDILSGIINKSKMSKSLPFDATAGMPEIPDSDFENAPILGSPEDTGRMPSSGVEKKEPTSVDRFLDMFKSRQNEDLTGLTEEEKLNKEYGNTLKNKDRDMFIDEMLKSVNQISAGYGGLGGAGAVLKVNENKPTTGDDYDTKLKGILSRIETKRKSERDKKVELSKIDREAKTDAYRNSMLNTRIRGQDLNQSEKDRDEISKLQNDMLKDPSLKRYNEIDDAANNAQTSLDTDTPMGAEMARTAMVRFNEKGALSNEDRATLGGSQAILDVLKRNFQRATNGEPLLDKDKKDMNKIIEAVKRQSNKNVLERQKYYARLGSKRINKSEEETYELLNPGVSYGNKEEDKSPNQSKVESVDKVKLLAPNGKVILVPQEKVDEAISKGAKKVN